MTFGNVHNYYQVPRLCKLIGEKQKRAQGILLPCYPLFFFYFQTLSKDNCGFAPDFTSTPLPWYYCTFISYHTLIFNIQKSSISSKFSFPIFSNFIGLLYLKKKKILFLILSQSISISLVFYYRISSFLSYCPFSCCISLSLPLFFIF